MSKFSYDDRFFNDFGMPITFGDLTTIPYAFEDCSLRATYTEFGEYHSYEYRLIFSGNGTNSVWKISTACVRMEFCRPHGTPPIIDTTLNVASSSVGSTAGIRRGYYQ